MPVIEIEYGKLKKTVECEKNTLLMEVLKKAGTVPVSPCGGRGTCGKCVVLINDGSGARKVLACRTYVELDCSVTVPEDSGEINWNGTLSDGRFGRIACGLNHKGHQETGTGNVLDAVDQAWDYGAVIPGREGLGLAVDLGTTTVAVKLYDLAKGKQLGTKSEWNGQKAYGADVITRIQYCMDQRDGLQLLGDAVRSQIRKMAGFLCMKKGREPGDIKEIYLCGNTVMEHIFAGISPVTIASVPYEPECYFDDGEALKFSKDGGAGTGKGKAFMPARTYAAPCVSGYVGGDITSGLLGSGLWRKPGKNLFIDVGTNGEMALGGADGFVTCAVASGPAFEGAGIACGMQAMDGAISRAWLEQGSLKLEVVGGGAPKGICGSGLLDLTACLLELGVVNKRGKLNPDSALFSGKPNSEKSHVNGNLNSEKPQVSGKPNSEMPHVNGNLNSEMPHVNGNLNSEMPCVTGKGADARVNLTEDGSVYLCQKDIRQLQLAKAAVSAGIKVLLQEAELKVEDLDGLYLAGGFGNRLNPVSAIKIGMLPAGVEIHAVGNAALAGAEDALLNLSLRKTLMDIKTSCRYIELSTSSAFSEEYINQLNF